MGLSVRPSEIPSVRSQNEMSSLWTQLLLQFYTDLKMHVVLGLSSQYFWSLFSTSFFPGPITIRLDTLWAQLLLEFSTNHFETNLTCTSWSEDVHVVLGSSSHFSLPEPKAYKVSL